MYLNLWYKELKVENIFLETFLISKVWPLQYLVHYFFSKS